MIYFKETVIGKFGIEGKDGSITKTVFENDLSKIGENCRDFTASSDVPPVVAEAFKQLEEYFDGTRKEFTLPLAPAGTPFMQKVWAALCEIPYGETATYKEIAETAGNPKACRAVGMANNKNPIAVFIPCHRVIGSSGKLVGYAGGTDVKHKLLVLENKNFKEK
ncbi:Methylated-DNA--protein-cysteine methyltransferase, constitutive [Methanimicrococcus sp. At1]|uniref:Methylated-DNA--protein-cysteine methyltransferase n=1 Tax=Methanimicrococcus hacksteinii TaxID=3028293 RepID=A0ABU3VM75_9EURY|nr:methylated-DNA--[protein]-cysteine S-methyltransferase [Methanimicrococcus sp. At1]MDV0444509.1 Methylated-DNA--protein-cysteine methyltransferase, constitutive [Methanimicrococcus sp. At1]